MTTIHEETIAGIRGLMAKAHSDAKALQGRIEAAGREASPSEQRQLDRLFEQFDVYERELKAATVEGDEAAALAAIASLPHGRLAAPNPIAGGWAHSGARAAPSIGTRAAPTFDNVFRGRPPHADPYASRFGSFGEFALAVAGGSDERLLRNASTMTEGSGPGGGFLVPVGYFGPILDAALAVEVVRPRAQVIPMTGQTATAGAFDYSDNAGAKRGGLQLTWGSEAAALAEQKGKLREISLSAKKASIFVRVSNELAADAVAFDQQLSAAMVAAVAAGLDYAFLNGTGAGMPVGVLHSAATLTQGSGGASQKLLLSHLAAMAGSLAPSSDARAIWVAHPTVRQLLYGMAYEVRNLAGAEVVGGGAVMPITTDGAGNLRIFGRECVFTDAMNVKFTLGDIGLFDFSRYAIGLRADATILRDNSVFFASDEVAFRLILRLDGQPLDAVATLLRDGVTYVSPFVTLDART